MENIKKTGVFIFVVGMVALAIQQMYYADLRPVFLSSVPAWLPGYAVWVYAANIAIIVACAAIILTKWGKQAAVLIATTILLLFIINHLPYQAVNYPTNPGSWTSALKGLSISGCFFIVAGVLPASKNEHTGPVMKLLYKLIPGGSVFFAIMMIVFGIDHFLYPEFVATLVPNWIPGHVFWTYFAGVALVGSGLAIMLGIKTRLAATLLGIMLFIWFAILHIPRAVADPYSGDGNELRSVYESFAFSGIAFIIAAAPLRKWNLFSGRQRILRHQQAATA